PVLLDARRRPDAVARSDRRFHRRSAARDTEMIDTLLIGYGNTLRGDDGVGPRVAEAVARWNRPGVQAVAVQQLLPELAASMATVRRVILVDARVDAETVQIEPLSLSDVESALGHAPEPRWLLSLTAQLYDRCPE